MGIPNNWRSAPQRYRMEAVVCKNCGRLFFPPRLVCDACSSRKMENVTLPVEGEVSTYTVIRVPATAFSKQTPYIVAIVALNNGARICMQVTDCGPEEVYIGMPVHIEFRRISEDGDAGVIHYGYKAVPTI